MIKKIALCFAFFFAFSFSCAEKKKEVEVSSECEQIKDIVTDCMGLHRGAFDYIKSCGDASLKEIKSINNCKDIINYIENN
jgi:hypothetical protein